MAAHTLEVFFDFSSPFAYLATTQVEPLAARTGAELLWRPMLLGAVFKAIDGPLVPIQNFPPPKQRNYLKDLYRWAEHFDVPFRFPEQFPMMTVLPLRVATLLGTPACAPFVHATFRAYWAEGRDISSPDVVRGLLAELGPPASLVEDTQRPETKAALAATTQEAVDRGVFGAPTFFVDRDLLFWGQDRLVLVERALGGWRPKEG